jgi:predicted aspartyl protease
LDVNTLVQDVELQLGGEDLYATHTAVRHLGEIQLNSHSVNVMISPALRKHPAFSPWLCNGRELYNRTPGAPMVCTLKFGVQARHVQDNADKYGRHHASFDVRVGGGSVRALFDTGANCSCLSRGFAKSLGIAWSSIHQPEKIGGIGGSVVILGKVTHPVKIGKFQIAQTFSVVSAPIAGYECLLGEDFFQDNSCAISFGLSSVEVHVGRNNRGEPAASLTRSVVPKPLPDLHAVQPEHWGDDPASVSVVQTGSDLHLGSPTSHAEHKRLHRQIMLGHQVAYRVVVSPRETVATTDQNPVPPELQEVLEKHSTPGGTLCGSIPDNTHAKGYSCNIELVPGAHPVCIRQYRLTPLEKAELLLQVDAFVAKGWIEPSTSSWSSSVLFVPKPGNKLRFCVDYRKLNQNTIVDSGNLPLMGELLDSLLGAKLFSALDLASGYYQLAMAPKSRECTAFPTPYGLYQWRVMPMGLCNAPAIFQRAMNVILASHIAAGYCLVYLDDIIIKSKTVGLHAVHVDAVLTSLHKHNLFCQLPKCFWARNELKYLGHLVNGEGVKPNPEKVASLANWHPPFEQIEVLKSEPSNPIRAVARKQIVHECRRFLGFMNYFNRFIPQYAKLACCLHDQTADSAPDWSSRCTAAWESMKRVLCSATMMHHPDFTLPFHVYSDASIQAVGGVLMQEKNGKLAPIAYCARKLSSAERNYTTTEQEMLGMVYCFMQWRCYLEGAPTVLHTDHEPLTWLHSQARPNRRQARWLEFLSRFTYKILYVKGDENVVADALTRMLTIHPDEDRALICDNWPIELASEVAAVNCRATESGPADPPREVLPGLLRTDCSLPGIGPRRGMSVTAAIVRHLTGSGGCCPDTPGHSTRTSILAATAAAGGYTRRRNTQLGRQNVTGERSCAGEATETGMYSNTDVSLQVAEGVGDSTKCPQDTPREPVTRVFVPAVSKGTKRRLKQRGEGSFKELKVVRTTGTHEPMLKHIDIHMPPPDKTVPMMGFRDLGTASKPFPQGEVPLSTGDTAHNTLSSVDGADGSNEPVNRTRLDSSTNDLEKVDDWAELNRAECLFDDLFDRVRKALVSDLTTQTEEKRNALRVTFRDDLLWLDHRLYIPDDTELKYDILYWHHDVPWCAHLGIEKTLALVERSFYWPGMSGDIRQYIRTCHKCQANKTDRRVARPPLTPLPSPEINWKVLGVDLIVDLPVTVGDEYNAICVFVCHLSKMVRLCATRTTLTTEGFAKLFMREVFAHYGMPQTIVSDRGTHWNSEFFGSLCDILGIRLKMSTAYHPQTNGLVERTNEVISAALRHFVSADHRNWDQFLPLIEFALNSSYHQSLQSTPFALNRITVPRNPFDALLGLRPCTSELASTVGMSSYDSGACRTALQAHEQFQWARRCVHLAKSRMKERYDANHPLNLALYEQGQLVWFRMINIGLRHPSLRHKLVPKYVGPLKILECVGRNAVRLEMPSALKLIHPTVNISLVKPYFGRDNVSVPPVNIEGELEWEVLGISDHNVVKSRRKVGVNLVEFKVNWKGSYEDSWHEFVDLENSLDTLEAYLRNTCTRSVRCQIMNVLKPEEILLLSHDLRAEYSASKRRVGE